MSIHLTRYRDIPLSEIQAVHGTSYRERADWWNQLRGKPVRIIVPSIGVPREALCAEPHYLLAGGHPFDEGAAMVCSHYVEIGD